VFEKASEGRGRFVNGLESRRKRCAKSCLGFFIREMKTLNFFAFLI